MSSNASVGTSNSGKYSVKIYMCEIYCFLMLLTIAKTNTDNNENTEGNKS